MLFKQYFPESVKHLGDLVGDTQYKVLN